MIYHADLLAITKANTNFRIVLATNQHSQLVAMSLRPSETIGEEVHQVDQLLVIVAGTGRAVVGTKTIELEPNHVVVVPAGTKHNVINDRTEMMKLYTVYAPPEHAHGTVHATKAEAEADEHDQAENISPTI